MKSILLAIIFVASANLVSAQESNPLFLISANLRFGFIDKSGKVIIKPQFFEAGEFSEDLAAVRNDRNRWGYVNKTGSLIIDYKYTSAGEFSEGLARVQIEGTDAWNGLAGYIDKRGKMIIEPQFEVNVIKSFKHSSFAEGLAVFERDNKLGFIDKSGKIVIEPKYDMAYPFRNGRAMVSIGLKSGFIDNTGQEVIPIIYDGHETMAEFSEGLVQVCLEEESQGIFTHSILFIDKNGKEVLSLAGHDNMGFASGYFSEGLTNWAFENGKIGYINKKGEMIIPPLFDNTEGFSEGLAGVWIDGKYGFIDKTGTMVIEPQPYIYLPKFENGLARVSNNDGTFGYIDKKANYVWNPTKRSFP